MFCVHCGTKREKIERFCTECGKEQLQESSSSPEQPPEVNQAGSTTSLPKINQETYNDSALEESAIPSEEVATQEPSEGGDNKKAIGIFATIFAGLVLLIGVGLFLIFGASNVEVPDFSNLTQDEAIQLIEESRLTVGEITEEYSRRVEVGLVISQSPRAGSEVERGTSIDLAISLGEELGLVPDLTDLSLGPETIDVHPPSVSPFDLDIWGEDQIITLEFQGVTVDVLIPPWLNDIIDESYDEDFVFDDRVRGFINTGSAMYIMDRENNLLKTMVEVAGGAYYLHLTLREMNSAPDGHLELRRILLIVAGSTGIIAIINIIKTLRDRVHKRF